MASRPRPPPPAEEQVGQSLSLGEFQNVQSLSLSAARMILHAMINHRQKGSKDGSIAMPETETLNKTLDYLELFARFKDQETTQSVENILGNYDELDTFEKSQLASLCCVEVDEAKTLIPSLANKISDADLKDLLDQIIAKRQFMDS
ncbi:polymerase II polypeptide D [Viridothelium virens]|uniref:Polymerase II polypeptide D n=1 Tax=Viridothelium virens TaxID=1048519 RepID=A0A6A6H0Z1_VIRVR|nr:polymerase II polypeptide D [Viridothelium virens]